MMSFERRPLGRTSLEVTVLGLGCATMGGHRIPVTREEAEAIVRAAWAAGVRYVDTAPYYGFGQAERCVGDALRAVPRDEWVLSTKVGRLLRSEEHTSELQSHRYLHSFPTRRSSDLHPITVSDKPSVASATRCARSRATNGSCRQRSDDSLDRKSTRLNSSPTDIYTLSLHDALPICTLLRFRTSRALRRRRVARGPARRMGPVDKGRTTP